MKSRRFLSLVLACALAVMGVAASAADFPRRPLKIVVPFGAGGSGDLTIRTLLKFVDFGQPAVIVNMPGGGSSIGVMEVYNSRPDGYTLLANSPASMVVGELKKQFPAGVTSDMIPICVMGVDNPMFCVGKDAPYKTAQEFFEYAKANPGKIRVGSSGMSTMYINTLVVMDSAKVDLNYVSFDSATKSRAALLGGHIESIIATISENRALVAAGDLIPLFVFSAERSPFMPNVPTLKELGYDVTGCLGTRGVWAPKGTPAEVVEFLEAAFMKGLNNPEFKRVYLEDMGIEPVAWGSAETRKWVADNTAYYKDLLERYSAKK